MYVAYWLFCELLYVSDYILLVSELLAPYV